MSDAVSVVQAFFDDLGKPGNLLGALDAHFAEDGVWENTGMPTARGIDEARVLMQGLIDGVGVDALVIEVLGIAADGDLVLTERIDHLDKPGGERVMSLPVSGALTVSGGRIAAWRDYFDPRPFLPPG